MKANRLSRWLPAFLGLATLLVPSSPSSAALPAEIDSDATIILTIDETNNYPAVAGRLKLHGKGEGGTRYTGTFFDYLSQKTFPASADASDSAHPMVKLATAGGHIWSSATLFLGRIPTMVPCRSYRWPRTLTSGPFSLVANMTLAK